MRASVGRNWLRRQVDILEAALIFEDPEVIESVDDRDDYGEQRIRALGRVGAIFYLVAYTWRGDVRHLITAWKVEEHGRRRYQAILARRNQAIRAQGLTRATPADAPEIELDEEFWRNARIVSTAEPRKTSVHLRIDPEISRSSGPTGKGT